MAKRKKSRKRSKGRTAQQRKFGKAAKVCHREVGSMKGLNKSGRLKIMKKVGACIKQKLAA